MKKICNYCMIDLNFDIGSCPSCKHDGDGKCKFDKNTLLKKFDEKFRKWKRHSFYNAGKAFIEFREWIKEL